MISLKGYSSEEVINNSAPIVEEGYYQVTLVGYQPAVYNNTTTHKIKWQVVGAPPHLAAERGKYLYVNWKEDSPAYGKSVLRAGLACGIYSEARIRELIDKGEMPSPDFESWHNATCVCKVAHNEYNGKVYAIIGTDYYALDSDTAKEAAIVFDKSSIEAGKQITPQEDGTPF